MVVVNVIIQMPIFTFYLNNNLRNDYSQQQSLRKEPKQRQIKEDLYEGSMV
jgi:hypothetical protein